MTREEALSHFETQQVRAVSRAKRLALEAYYQENQDALVAEFISSFSRICERARAKQETDGKGPIGYIHYAMLRTALLDGGYEWRIDAYDGSWYRDPLECSEVYDAGWAFKYLVEFGAELNEKRQPYLNQIGGFDVERIMLREAGNYQCYVIALARRAMKVAATLPEYRKLKRECQVEIRAGEYFDQSEIVYREDGRIKDSKGIKRWFEEKLEAEYIAQVCVGLKLAGGDFEGIDLSYVDFRGSDLTGCNLNQAVLNGAGLSGCLMQGADMRQAQIYEADFQGCDLREARLSGVQGSSGLSGDEANWQPGFAGVDFRGARLARADFTEATLAGADFRGADLSGVRFDGADLKGARFSRDDESRVSRLLDEDQRREAIWDVAGIGQP